MVKKGKKRYCVTLDKVAQSLLEEYSKRYKVSYSAIIEGCIKVGCISQAVGNYSVDK